MSEKKLQFGINNTSDEWFKAKIDKKVLKELCRRSDWSGWRHIIIYFTSANVYSWAYNYVVNEALVQPKFIKRKI